MRASMRTGGITNATVTSSLLESVSMFYIILKFLPISHFVSKVKTEG